MSMREEIQSIITEAEDSGLSITAAAVVEKAKDAEQFPALNKHLWQVPEADLAQEARLTRAHRLLITMHVTIPETGERTRMLVHTSGVPGYQPISAVARVPDLALAKMRQLADDIARARGRLRAFKAALPDDIATEIDEALQEAETRTNRALEPITAEAAPA